MLFNHELVTDNLNRQKIRDYYHIDEKAVVDMLLPYAEVSMTARSKAWERARQLVLNIRQKQHHQHGIDALLNEYSLSSNEGVVLMCLAEALLRVPDKQTQEMLIRDKISQGHWSSHLGNSESLFVNASAWGLLITGSMVRYAAPASLLNQQHHQVKKLLARLGEPVIRKAMNIAMKIMGKQFVMGENIKDALARAETKERSGYVFSYDMLGEGARTAQDAQRYFNAYVDAIHHIGKAANNQGPKLSPGISVKLSALYPRYDFLKYEKVIAALPAKLKELCLLAKQYDIGLTVDAEEAERLDLSLDIIEQVFTDPELADWQGFGLAVQAYQKRALFVIDWLRELTIKQQKKIMVRLVKGAYWDREIKKCQKDGLPHFPVFTRKSSTDVSYHACANKLLAYRDTIYPQFATHNAYTAAVIVELAGDDKQGFEFQCLHGMGDALYDQIVQQEAIQCRIYAPVGDHENLLAYLVRRLLENGANSSFVNAIVDEQQSVESLLADPVEKTQNLTSVYNRQILQPIELFGESRVNSKGLDLTDINQLMPLKAQLNDALIALHKNKHALAKQHSGQLHPVVNPADSHEVLAFQLFDTADEMRLKLAQAEQAFNLWSAKPVAQRADLLRKIADIFERHRSELISLCIKEAGKTAQDSVDEIREAVDFCRYYAEQAENLCYDKRLTARGVALCISPWNFPLAIFIGQVVAALAVGNTVVAKPAEQTSLIAQKALVLMQAVGLPQGVVELVVAKGVDVGNTLLSEPAIKAVVFTGSTTTAQFIIKALAKRSGEQIPLIAETGGQNCMIVDSTALPEQVVDDVIASGFKSAGQRCSALRVLYLQEDIADNIIPMLIGAMQELTVGDPALLSTDIGPVIDQKALTSLNQHVEKMQKQAQLLFSCTMDTTTNKGTFFAPHLYLINHINQLSQEVFGPCVHIIKYQAADLAQVISDINNTGYGLTLGVHSRIESRAIEISKLVRVGNVYINRNMVGAVVGVQPFGGRGLSGTGPKAGGPNYLPRFMREVATPSLIDGQLDLAQVALQSDKKAIAEAAKLMHMAVVAETPWRLSSLNARVSFVRQLLAKLASVELLDTFADDLNRTLARCRQQLLHIEKKLKAPLTLPGPTGESNQLFLEPRGVLLCFADQEVTFEYWTLSIISALATGNVVIAVVSELFYQEALAFREKFISTGVAENVLQIAELKHTSALLMEKALAGLVVDSHCQRIAYFTKVLAERCGAIIPVISAEYADNLIQRLLTEKCISIDTTASGGNTSLMTLVEQED